MGASAARRRSPCSSTRSAATGQLRYENRNYRLQENDTLLVLVPHNHRYWLARDERWEYFWISMNGEEALRIHKSILSVSGPVLRLQPATIDHLADCSLRLVNGAASPGAASAIAYEAAMALYDDVFGSHAFAEKLSAMQPVIDHINANLDKPLPVADLGQISGLSRAHFSRCFAESEGLPPAEFVLQQRLQRAAKLLDQGGLPAGEGGRHPVRLRGRELFFQGLPPPLRHHARANSAPPACMPICGPRPGAASGSRTTRADAALGPALSGRVQAAAVQPCEISRRKLDVQRPQAVVEFVQRARADQRNRREGLAST